MNIQAQSIIINLNHQEAVMLGKIIGSLSGSNAQKLIAKSIHTKSPDDVPELDECSYFVHELYKKLYTQVLE